MAEAEGGIPAGAGDFIEGLGLFFEDFGVARIGGRLLGLLMVADRPLSLDAIARTLRVSRASVSTNARLILAAGMIERVGLPGDRRDYYGFSTEAWERTLQVEMKTAQTLRRLAAQALETLDPANAVGRARLREAVEFGDFYQQRLDAILRQWRERARPPPAAAGHYNQSQLTVTPAARGGRRTP